MSPTTEHTYSNILGENLFKKANLSKALKAIAFKKQQTRKLVFRRGDKVEVASREYGYIGAYYPATIVSRIGNSYYRVRYEDLLTEDETDLLEETVRADEVRPVPPKQDVLHEDLHLYSIVDVFADDGWWMGFISARDGSKYCVKFPTAGEEIAYPIQVLRFHQDWFNGYWISSK